jgi:hypothetical protein
LLQFAAFLAWGQKLNAFANLSDAQDAGKKRIGKPIPSSVSRSGPGELRSG